VLAPSGLAAIIVALMTALKAGDHLLMTDSVYEPSRAFADKALRRFGIETSYYDPTIGAGIDALMRPNTRAVLTESPGSLTLEVQDIPAIAEVAHARGACVILDNTWATPLFFSPHAHGVDLAVEAGTKYLSGHADLLLGLVSGNEQWFERLHRTIHLMAIPPGAEDVFLALRGLRTMELRLREAERQGLALAHWLSDRPEVLRVVHPALPDHPGHALWKRDFTGSSGLFSIVLKPVSEAGVAAFLDGLELFGLGYSWGGYESLAVPFDCTATRTATRFAPGGPTVRFSVGLEDIEDLKADLDRGFARLRATA
jgi:cystathionine beta-lyase